MARLGKIEKHGLTARVLTLAAGGVSLADIAKTINEENGVELTRQAVHDFLKKHQKDHVEATKNVREAAERKLLETAMSDIERLDNVYVKVYDGIMGAGAVMSKEFAQNVGQFKGLTELRLKIAGTLKGDIPGGNSDMTLEEAKALLKEQGLYN